jgi:hypothetical protein
MAVTVSSQAYRQGDAMTDDLALELAIKDASISMLQEKVLELQAHQERVISQLMEPTERMMLAGALAHNAGLRPLREAITAGEAKNIFVAMISVLKEYE